MPYHPDQWTTVLLQSYNVSNRDKNNIYQSEKKIISRISSIQSAGYYTSWINSPSTQRVYTDNCYYYARMFNQTMFKLFHFCDFALMRVFLTQIDKKDNRRISQIIADYDKIKRKYRKYFILNILSLGIISKFRRKKLKLKRIMQDQFQKS